MARRAFVRGAAAISQRRSTSWLQFQPVGSTQTAAGGTILFSLNAAALALRPFTVVRSRFLVSIETDQVANDEIQIGAVGLAVVSDEAVAVGVTAVPTPIGQMGSDLWFVHQLLYASFALSSAVGITGSHQKVYEIDSKAMRKVDAGQDLIVVVELSAAGDGFITVVGGRMLVKLH